MTTSAMAAVLQLLAALSKSNLEAVKTESFVFDQ